MIDKMGLVLFMGCCFISGWSISWLLGTETWEPIIACIAALLGMLLYCLLEASRRDHERKGD